MKPRRGRGEGTICQRKDGKWCAAFMVNAAILSGPRRRYVYGKTKKEVLDKLADLRSHIREGRLIETSRSTLQQFLGHWLEDAARPRIRWKTYVSYESVIRLQIRPRIGHLGLTRLLPSNVQALYSAMERDGKSARLRQLTHAVLRSALGQAMKWGLITRNVCDAVEPPRAQSRPMQTLDEEQACKFLSIARDDKHFPLYVLALTTGMRRGELLGLQWDDIDWKRGTLSVRRTLVESGKLEVGEPKTRKGRRLIVLPKFAQAALQEQRQLAVESKTKSPWVFFDDKGGPLRPSNLVRRSFLPLLARAGLPRIRFHDLRHTAATLLLRAGVHPKIVQELLGHATIAITLDTYSHVLPSMQREAAGKLDELFGSALLHRPTPKSLTA